MLIYYLFLLWRPALLSQGHMCGGGTAVAVQVCVLTDSKTLAVKARAAGLKAASMQVRWNTHYIVTAFVFLPEPRCPLAPLHP